MNIQQIRQRVYFWRYFPSKNTRKKVIHAIAWLMPVGIAFFSLRTAHTAKNLAADSNMMAKDAVVRLEEEKIVIQFHGGVTCDDYKTQFATIPSMAGPKKTVITTLWPIIISNNGLNTVSIIASEVSSRIHGGKRNIETSFLDKRHSPMSLPIVVGSGESIKVYLVVPVHISSSVLKLVEDVTEFSESFTPEQLSEYLKKKHGLDFYGNTYRYAEKYAGVGSDRVAVHIFQCNEDGTLSEKGMQADQLTIEFKTARANYFSARALYYHPPPFKPRPTIYLRQGTPARVEFKLEAMDSLPKITDSNTSFPE